MHAHQLAELSALTSVYGQQLISADAETVASAMTAYWQASRCRLDRWCRSLRRLTIRGDTWQWSPEAVGLIEEILVSAILSRTVAAVCVAHDKQHDTAENGPIGRNILGGHFDARRRAMALVNAATNRGDPNADAIMALDRQCDRWSDLVLAYLAPQIAIEEFAASPVRVHDFVYDARHHVQSAASINMAVTMIVTGMRSSFERLGIGPAPNGDLNRAIAAAIVGCFPSQFFDSHGLLRSAWVERLRATTNESPGDVSIWWPPSAGDSASQQIARRRW